MELTIPIKLLLSLLLGAAIGLERESYEKGASDKPSPIPGNLGVRTYALITTLGTIAAVLAQDYWLMFLIISATFSVLLVVYYIFGSIINKDHGLTTDIAILWAYVIGVIIGFEALPIQIVVAMVVCLIIILSAKKRVQTFVMGIKQYELEGFIGYAIIALVILPFLPDVSYTLGDIPFLSSLLAAYGLHGGSFMNLEIINPFGIWRVVVLITGIEIVGYLMEKTLGQRKGWLLTSIAGGFISSTSTTQSLANQSRQAKNTNQLVAAAVFSNLSSFVQHFILLASINGIFLAKNTLYIAGTSLAALSAGLYFYWKSGSKSSTKNEENLTDTKAVLERDHIFSLKPALQFAALFMVIKIVTKLALVLFGDGGFIAGNVIAAVTGLDAVTINISELVGKNITYNTGMIALILANATNLGAKSLYAFMQGSPDFARKLGVSMGIMIAGSMLGLLALS